VSAAGRVLVVGTLNVDRIWHVPSLPSPGQTVIATSTEQQFGGKGANQAVAAARQGACVTLLGTVGNDAAGQAYRARLEQEQIDVAHVHLEPDVPTGTAHVYVDPRGENLIVVAPGANACLMAAAVSAAWPAVNADVLLVQLECPLEAVVCALKLAGQRGLRSVLNASPTNTAFPWGETSIDTLLVNQHECSAALGVSAPELWELSGNARAALLLRKCVTHVVVTQGAEPTLYFSGEARLSVPTHAVQPRDTVGAGDTFAGCLAAELARGRDWPSALAYANVAAALATLAVGAQAAMPSRPQVEAAMR
jgi:ribokinase